MTGVPGQTAGCFALPCWRRCHSSVSELALVVPEPLPQRLLRRRGERQRSPGSLPPSTSVAGSAALPASGVASASGFAVSGRRLLLTACQLLWCGVRNLNCRRHFACRRQLGRARDAGRGGSFGRRSALGAACGRPGTSLTGCGCADGDAGCSRCNRDSSEDGGDTPA